MYFKTLIFLLIGLTLTLAEVIDIDFLVEAEQLQDEVIKFDHVNPEDEKNEPWNAFEYVECSEEEVDQLRANLSGMILNDYGYDSDFDSSYGIPVDRCRRNELYYPTAPCQSGCLNYWTPTSCQQNQPRPGGCFCRQGYYKHPITQRCVPGTCCPPPRDPCYGFQKPHIPRCRDPNAGYSDQRLVCSDYSCGGGGSNTYYSGSRPQRCKPRYRSGCFCNRGYHREVETGRCSSCGGSSYPDEDYDDFE